MSNDRRCNTSNYRTLGQLLSVVLTFTLVTAPIPVFAQDAPLPATPTDNRDAQQHLFLPLINQDSAASPADPSEQDQGNEQISELISQTVTVPWEMDLSANAPAQTPLEFEALLDSLAQTEAAQQPAAATAMLDSIVVLPAEMHSAITQSLLRSVYSSSQASPWVISTYRSEGNWVEAIAVPQYIVDAGWEIEFSDAELVKVLAWRAPSGRYYTYAEGSEGFNLLAAAVPVSFADYRSDGAVDSAAAAAEAYLFPWTSGQKWYKNGGWHTGSDWASGDAIDFQPQAASSNYAVNYALLAPISGSFTRICGPDTVGQSAVRIVNSSVGTTKILHVDDGSIPAKLLSQQVVRGQYLGHSHVPNKAKDLGCGLGSARHIHVALPSKTMTVDGNAAGDLAKAGFGSLYTSTNQRVDNHLAKVTVAKVWTNGGSSDWNSSKTTFRPGDPVRYVGAVNNSTSSALTAYFVFEANGPGGRIAYYSGNLSTGSGTTQWGLGSTIPANAASGVYTFRVTVTYNGASNSQSSTFTVQGLDCTGKYKAEYFRNRDVNGSPTYVACEGWPISHDWGNGGPGNGIGNDDFSVRWTGTASFTAGRYRFVTEADDGVRVWIDGTQILNEWRDQGTTTFRPERDMSAGNHQIRVEYYEHGGGAVARFRWEQVSGGGSGSSGNISRGRPSYASSQENSGYVAAKANDGNTGTRWSSQISASLGTQWWYVDLGGKSYDKVRIKWENAYAVDHFIGWSDNCTSYSGKYYTINTPGTYTYDIGSHTEKCVAVFMFKRASRMNNYSIWEIEIAKGSFALSSAGTDEAQSESVLELEDGQVVVPYGEGTLLLTPEVQSNIYLPAITN